MIGESCLLKSSPQSKADYLEAVFISDLHLHPDIPAISKRFDQFIDWAARSTRTLYILGDFFHVWPGDEALDDWSGAIAAKLAWLSEQGVSVFYMPGNRDFLLGKRFFKRAKLQVLAEPSVIQLGNLSVMLAHGDRYCTKDKAHQCLRRLTRNRLFKTLFLQFPYKLRKRIVNGIRQHSETNRYKPPVTLAVVEEAVAKHVAKYRTKTLIHGHTHQPGLTTHRSYQRYVLSDWDEAPVFLCYNESRNLFFGHIGSS